MRNRGEDIIINGKIIISECVKNEKVRLAKQEGIKWKVLDASVGLMGDNIDQLKYLLHENFNLKLSPKHKVPKTATRPDQDQLYYKSPSCNNFNAKKLSDEFGIPTHRELDINKWNSLVQRFARQHRMSLTCVMYSI